MPTRKQKPVIDVQPASDPPAAADKPATKGKRARRTRPNTPTRVREKSVATLKAAMIKAFLKVGTVREACIRVGIGRTTHYDWIVADDGYAKKFDDAVEDRADMLEAEAYRRGVEGVKRPVVYKGKVIGATIEYSDVLLLAQLKAARPERYRERYDINFGKMSDSELVAFARSKGIDIRNLPATALITAGTAGDDPKPN